MENRRDIADSTRDLDDDADFPALHQTNVSILLPGSSEFSSLLSLSYYTLVAGDEAWDIWELPWDVHRPIADALEQFVCGTVNPESAHCGILLCSLLLYGVGQQRRACTAPDEQLLIQYLSQNPLMDPLKLWMSQIGLTQAGQLMLLGGGALTNDFPAMTETKSSEEVDVAFIADHQVGVSAVEPASVHAKVAVERLAGTSRAMSDFVAAPGGWETATFALLEEVRTSPLA